MHTLEQRKSLTKFCVSSPRDFSFLLSANIKIKKAAINFPVTNCDCFCESNKARDKNFGITKKEKNKELPVLDDPDNLRTEPEFDFSF